MSRKLSLFFRATFSLVLLGIVLRKVEWGRLAGALAHARWEAVVLALPLLPLLIFLLALRWRIFLRQQQLLLPLWPIVVTTWAGQFFNAFLPGSTGGDLIKVVQVCRWYPHKKSSGVASILLDRISALLALLVFVGFSLILQPVPCSNFGMSQAAGWGLVFFIGLLGAVALGLVLRFSGSLRAKVGHVLLAAKSACSSRRSLAAGFAMSCVVHLVNFLFFFVSAKVVGFDIAFGQVLLICPVVLLLTMLPLTINGHGVREIILISYFQALGISAPGGIPESVVALSLVAISLDFLWSFPGGLFYLFGFNKNPVQT